MSLPKFLEPFLPSYDISQMDLKNPDDKKINLGQKSRNIN